jgi:hypothetical protein
VPKSARLHPRPDRRDHLCLVRPAAAEELREHVALAAGEALVVGEDLELARAARLEACFEAEGFLDEGGETRRARPVASRRAVDDPDDHGGLSWGSTCQKV